MKQIWLAWYLFLLFFLSFLFSCSSNKQPVPASIPNNRISIKPKPKISYSLPKKTENEFSQEVSESVVLEPQKPLPRIQYLPKKVLPKKKSKKVYDIKLDLENADLLEFLDIIFIKTLHKNYIVDPTIQAKVTIHLTGKFTEEELEKILKQVLEIQNITLICTKKICRVTSINNIGHLSESYNFAIFRPHYLSPRYLLPVVKAFSSRQATIIVNKESRTIIVLDNPENLQKIIKIVNLLDQNFLEGFYIEIYKPKVLEAEKLSNYLDKIFSSGIFPSNTTKNFVDFIPIEELNSLLILAREKDILTRVKRWIEQLDQGETLKKQVFVYYVENGNAEEIAQILENAFKTTIESKRKTVIKAKQKPSSQNTKTVEGNITIIPDKTNNLLVITASPEDYRTILNLLKEIDIIPRQVLIEVLIAEISLNKNLEYGVEWWIKSNFNIDNKRYTIDIVSYNKYMGQAGKGFSFTVYRGIDPRALLNALSEVSEVHILSNPVILATDNKEAKIQIGEEVPTINQRVVNTNAQTPNITQNIQYRDVGIILQVKPHINSSGLVKLDIVQEISSVSNKTVTGVISPVFTKRKIETSLVVQDGHTVIFGGLIQNQHSTNNSGVPGVKNIPIIGNFFKWKGDTKEKKELLVAITPRVIRNLEEAGNVMKDYRRKIDDLKKKLFEEFGK